MKTMCQNNSDMSIIDTLKSVIGKTVYVLKQIETSYHYETRELGYDHLGSLGRERIKVVDEYYWRIEEIKIKPNNLGEVYRKLEMGFAFENYEDAKAKIELKEKNNG